MATEAIKCLVLAELTELTACRKAGQAAQSTGTLCVHYDADLHHTITIQAYNTTEAYPSEPGFTHASCCMWPCI